MKTRPPDLTLFAARNGGTFPAALVGKIIDGRQPLPGHGGPDMPVWGDAFRRVNENLGMSATARTAILSSTLVTERCVPSWQFQAHQDELVADLLRPRPDEHLIA